ncbi:superfamily I DNA/RNA helicase [Glaciihabitans tibetensis]|uniref:DNA 3'-5' helicase n=1 Tax=Glaciihabitans tibetensis TaxID=1266600 RepID=A0A2T0VGV5_9MICO|nr:ATP-dependent DNA helicase [Glaciihabitans tibetensis]PRY69442.1 superfamily I DNA/RNA helicase [Glaciihabitans tibetensis]
MNITGFERRREVSSAATGPSPDVSQLAVLALPEGSSAAVLGAPGTGKTFTLVELVADRVLNRGYAPDEIVALTPTRASATRLRDALALRVGVATNGPLARTVNSLAHEVVGAAARSAGVAPPRLVTGGEQDADIAQLLHGHAEEGTGPVWPAMLTPDVRRLRGFRSELRELMMRATEFNVSPARLRALGREFDRAEWTAAADFIGEYHDVIGNFRDNQLDSAELAQYAATAIASADPGERIQRLRLVVIDDLQEATESTLAILRALAGRGITIVAFGDPDVAANAFRGGEPDALGRLGAILRSPVQTLVLQRAHRQGPLLRNLTASVTSRIGTAAAGSQRAAVAGRTEDDDEIPPVVMPPILTLSASTPARQWSAVARHLREQHLVNDVPWSQMVVVVRSGAQIAGIRRSLSLAEVPARTTVGATALREDRAARALLTLVDVGAGRTALTPALAAELLLGPFGGLDRLMLRRLRLALRAEEIAGGNLRSSDELLVEALSAPGRFATIDHRVGRSADRLATTLAEIRTLAETDGTIEELLWLAWERSGLASTWFEQALSAGITAAEANSNLDGVVALFTAAKRFVERQPGTPAGVFLSAVLDAEVPEDTLSPQPNDDAVLVTTPPGTVGLEFAIVVVANLQDGAWPNLRLRGSLLGPQELVRAITGIDSATLDERKLVLGDELRMFALAVSRARSQVVLATVANEDDAPSVFLTLAPKDTPVIDTSSLPPLSLRGLTGRLRRDLVQPGRSVTRAASDRAAAASALARLAAEHVPGADPAQWHGLLEPSTTEPMFGEEEKVPVSPSRLERFEDSPLDWFIETIAGSESSTSMGLGTILHWAMETATDPSIDRLWDSVESRWKELPFESEWMAETQKRTARVLVAAIGEYLADFQREGKTLVGAEKRFSLDIGRAQVNGSIDRIERAADGSVHIVDLKTGTPITQPAKIAAHPQLGAYQLAYAQGVLDEFLDELGEHHAGGAKLLYVKKGVRSKLYRESVQPPLDEEALEGFRTRIRQAAVGMAAAEYEGAIELRSWGSGGTSNLAIHRVRAVSSD